MPRTAKIETLSGEIVRLEIEDGRQYRKRVELSYEGRTVVYGIRRDRGETVAEFVASYDDDSLQGIGGDSVQPDWAESTLGELEITEVRA
ncbi:hypothetical protein G9C85_00240 [Halorubellus sp. JP-L1]|uniref:hypothetical protein n=1 Tax=Halorubellus sp. JP-L1 TaxID=2715753 RepID=UPI0014095A6A|nr:hypothetical protein [Halorubellus sp. JP-L1]NHN40067.1 hypothetical protein [Halorubellus sp. JP-L1]